MSHSTSHLRYLFLWLSLTRHKRMWARSCYTSTRWRTKNPHSDHTLVSLLVALWSPWGWINSITEANSAAGGRAWSSQPEPLSQFASLKWTSSGSMGWGGGCPHVWMRSVTESCLIMSKWELEKGRESKGKSSDHLPGRSACAAAPRPSATLSAGLHSVRPDWHFPGRENEKDQELKSHLAERLFCLDVGAPAVQTTFNQIPLSRSAVNLPIKYAAK